MSASAKKPTQTLEQRARRLAESKGADPNRLLAWALRPGGQVVIITADGKKFSE